MTFTIFVRWYHGSVPSITSSLSPSTSWRTTCTSHVCNELCCPANTRRVNDHEAFRDGTRQRHAAFARTPHSDSDSAQLPSYRCPFFSMISTTEKCREHTSACSEWSVRYESECERRRQEDRQRVRDETAKRPSRGWEKGGPRQMFVPAAKASFLGPLNSRVVCLRLHELTKFGRGIKEAKAEVFICFPGWAFLFGLCICK
ncbi:unnamed protein product [Scytosiphon promiscuus]